MPRSPRLGSQDYLAFFLVAAFLALGVWRVVTGDTWFGVFYLALAAAWLGITIRWRRKVRR